MEKSVKKEIIANAKSKVVPNFFDYYGTAMLGSLVIAALTFITLGVAPVLLGGAYILGMTAFTLNVYRKGSTGFTSFIDTYKNFGNSFNLYFNVYARIFLWSLLFWVPGIIAAIRYSQAFYLMSDNPEMGATEAIETSKKMMEGHKMEYFLFNLGFIGWYILCSIFPVGYLWLVPYVTYANAGFYENLKKSAAANA